MVTFEQWELSARFALADRGIGYYGSEPIIAGVRQHCLATGQSPAEAFGDPQQFADDTIRNRMQRPGAYLSGQLFLLALAGITLAVLFAMADLSWGIPATPAGLAGAAALIAASFAAWGVPQALFSAGRPVLAVISRVSAPLLAISGIGAYLVLSHGRLFHIPVLAVIGAAVGVLILATRRR